MSTPFDWCTDCGHGSVAHHAGPCSWGCDCKKYAAHVPSLLPRQLQDIEGQIWAAAYGAAFTERAIVELDQRWRYVEVEPLTAEWPWYVADKAVDCYRKWLVEKAVPAHEKAKSI